MAGRAQSIQAEAGNVTVQGNKRHLNGGNNDYKGSDKSPPSVQYRAIDAGNIFLDLEPQRGGGPQRPLKTPCHEAAFLDNDAPFYLTESDGSEQEHQEKDRMERNRCDKESLALVQPSPLPIVRTHRIYTTPGTSRKIFQGQSRIRRRTCRRRYSATIVIGN